MNRILNADSSAKSSSSLAASLACTGKFPEGAVIMTPLEMNAIRFCGKRTILTPSLLESSTKVQPAAS